ncbi:MAG: glycosyltransferase [Prevotella sp.]
MKKKVLFLMPAMTGGGAEKVLVDILRHFDFERYEVSLFLEFREGTYLEDIPDAVQMVTLHGKNNLWFQRIHRQLQEHCWLVGFYYWAYRLMFLWKLREKNYDVVVSFMEGSAVRFHSYIFHKARKHLSWVHIDLLRKHWSLGFFKNEAEEQSIYGKMDKIVFVSNDAQRSFLKMYSMIEYEKCVVQYNLIDVKNILSKTGSKCVEKKKFTICMVGRLNRQKRYDRAVEVAHRLKTDGLDFELWILGEGELRSTIESKIEEYGLEHTVLLKGFVKPPYPYVSQSDFFLCTSESEGFSLVIAEAFCMGIPVVSTNVTGPTELLGNSEYGMLTEENVDSIYHAVKSLMTDEHLRNHYAAKSIERSKIFSEEKFMKDFYSLLNE